MKKIFGQIDLTIGSAMSNLLLFALPFFITYFLNSLYSAVDLMFIGQYSDTYNIAAVSSGTTIMFAVNSVITGLATGGTVVIGQYFGAKNKNINHVIKNYITYMGILMIAITLIMLALFYPMISWMKLDEGAVRTARMYLFILVLGIPFYVGYTTISAILRGIGNSFAPFVIFSFAVVSNIGLDALFVIGLNMSAVGAAFATIIGEAIGLIVAIIYLLIFKLPYKIKYDLHLDRHCIKEFVKCGFPIAIQDGLVIMSFAIILASVSTRGVDYTSAVGITDRVTSFGFAPLSAIACSISAATAQNMGAKKVDRVKHYVRSGWILAIIFAAIVGTLCQLIPKELAMIFGGNNENAVNIATDYIRTTSIDIFICAFIFPLNSMFIGAGHTVFAMAQNLGVTFLVRLPMALILAIPVNAPMAYVGLAYPTSSVFSAIACYVYYLSNKWRNLKTLSVNVSEANS